VDAQAPGPGERVPAIARLGERVGGEADADAEVDELVDGGGVLPLVEVVHELGALVADVPRMLETRRPLHERQRSSDVPGSPGTTSERDLCDTGPWPPASRTPSPSSSTSTRC